MYRIHQIKLKLGESTDCLPQKILKLIGNRELLISEWHIVKESIDARDKKHIRLVYSVDFTAVYKKNPKKQARLAANPKLKLEEAPNLAYVPAVYEGEMCASEDENRAEEPLPPARQALKPERKLQQDRAEEPLLPARQNAKPERKLQQDKNLPTSQTETPQPRSGMPEPLPSARVLRDRPIIVGFGPAGMFAALILAQAGLRPLVLERGQEVDARTASVERFWREGTLNEQSNVQFGEGGAGTFSDGKLTTGIKDARIRKVLEEFVAAGAPKEILYKQKPHIGTDVLRLVVKNIREEIKRLGGEVRFNTLVEDLRVEDGRVSGVICAQDGAETDHESGAQPQEQNCGDLAPKLAQNSEDSRGIPTRCIPCQTVIFAMGHSARDTFRRLRARGIAMSQKPFSVGVRIEHPQDMIDIAQYGAPGRELGLPPADYKLSWRCENGRGVYTFCMCPGGKVVIASSQAGGVVTNGMSYHDRASGIANSALLCDVRTSDFGSDDVLAGVIFQEKLEHQAFLAGGSSYAPPRCTWGELRNGQAPQVESCLPNFAVAALREAMPHLGRKLHGFDNPDAMVTAVETRSSSPVRFARNADYEGACSAAAGTARSKFAGTPHYAADAVMLDTAKHETGISTNAPHYAADAAPCDNSMPTVGNVTEPADGKTLIGFYPCGEGAGYAGGIMSAAVDGIRVAETIIRKWKPLYL
ncbi:MAG: NAD(P)/FAD-dependent oxidoreductase [Clostridia bacterium]